MIAGESTGPPRVGGAASGAVALGSRTSGSLARELDRLASSLLIAAPQAGALACVRDRGGLVNTHFRPFDEPAAVAVGPGRSRSPRAPKCGSSVTCRRGPRRSSRRVLRPAPCYVTGPAGIVDMAFAGDELWLASSELSCLATLDDEHSLVPRWSPPFVTAAGPGRPLPPQRLRAASRGTPPSPRLSGPRTSPAAGVPASPTAACCST